MSNICIGDSITASQNEYSYVLTVSDLLKTDGATLYYGNYSKYKNNTLCFSFDSDFWGWFDDDVFTIILNEFDLGI